MTFFRPLSALPGHQINRSAFPRAFDRLTVQPAFLQASLIQAQAFILSLPRYRPAHHILLLAALRVATY